MLCIILSTTYIFIAGRSFHSETASYDVISRNHSSWPSLNSYRLGKLYLNIPVIYKLARTICYYCCGKFKCILILGLKVKSFWNSATFQKLWGRVPFIPLPCTTVGVWICVYVRVEEAYIKKAPFILLTLKISCIF